MRTILFIIKVLYKKRWWLIITPLVAAIIVFLALKAKPNQYRSTTTIYTGIVSGYDALSTSAVAQDWMAVNNAIDNLISIIKAESTLENVYLRLISLNLVHLDVTRDNDFLTAKSSKKLANDIPDDVMKLVDKNSVDSTYARISAYYHKDRTNCLRQMFLWDDPQYSYNALSRVQVERIGNSDMINIAYVNDDQYIVYNTLKIIVDEFIDQYMILRYEQTNDVVGYFEEELARIQAELNAKENALTEYNITNRIINYEEQTKMVAERSKGLDVSIEEASRELEGARERRAILEDKMGVAANLLRTNTEFINKLHDISSLYTESSRARTEADADEINEMINRETGSLRGISSNIANSKFSKEGLSIDAMTTEWLDAVLSEAKAQAELDVLKSNKVDVYDDIERYSPVGSSLKRQTREIQFSEQNYLSNLQALNEAKLRKKNLQLSSATFKVLSPATVALTPMKNKNRLYTAIAFVLVFLLLSVIEIIKELFNKKPYDISAAERLCCNPVIGAFPYNKGKEYDDVCEDFACNQLGNALVNMFDRSKNNQIINILSLKEGEGKSYIAQSLYKYFDKLELKPVYVSYHNDFDSDSKYFMLAGSIYDFAVNENNMDALPEAGVTIVEYPPLSNTSFPSKLLVNTAANLLIVDSDREWKEMDRILLRQVRESVPKDTKINICLNGADKDTVGKFTGILPPFSLRHKIRFAMWNIDDTSFK